MEPALHVAGVFAKSETFYVSDLCAFIMEGFALRG